jgi:hypothetical protein
VEEPQYLRSRQRPVVLDAYNYIRTRVCLSIVIACEHIGQNGNLGRVGEMGLKVTAERRGILPMEDDMHRRSPSQILAG